VPGDQHAAVRTQNPAGVHQCGFQIRPEQGRVDRDNVVGVVVRKRQRTGDMLLTADAPVWQELVRRRITQLDSDIARLSRARDCLSGSLRCPADHPAADCPYGQREIDDLLNAVGGSAAP
jgi:hypothetical protein